MIKNPIPQPSLSALKQSAQLISIIKQEISHKGAIPFARFMELALYDPNLGYYTSGNPKLGKEGDFSTGPEISSLYSYCIARQCQQVLWELPGGNILEFGAGTGTMAADILLALAALDSLPKHYYIMEISNDLKRRQQETIKAKAAHLLHRVVWLESLENFSLHGIVLANEVLDAFPVHRFKWLDNKLSECYVNLDKTGLILEWKNPCFSLQEYIKSLNWDWAEDYESECNLSLMSWMTQVADILKKGLVLIIDYGFPRQEYYHPDRKRGTLVCHYRHHFHFDPLILIGLQDITAHLDFTAVAEAALAANLMLAGFTSQAGFLISCGMLDILRNQPEDQYLQLANEVKILTSPNEMGELFKVMAITKGIERPLLGFSLKDMSVRL